MTPIALPFAKLCESSTSKPVALGGAGAPIRVAQSIIESSSSSEAASFKIEEPVSPTLPEVVEEKN